MRGRFTRAPSEEYSLSEMVKTEALSGSDWSFSGLLEDKFAKKGDKFGKIGHFTVGRIRTRTAANREGIGMMIVVLAGLGAAPKLT